MKKIFIWMILSVMVLSLFASCNTAKDSSSSLPTINENASFSAVTFESVEEADDLNAFYAQGNDNAAHSDGIAIADKFTVKSGETDLPAYMVPVTYGVHSFTFVDTKKSEFPIEFSVKVGFKFNKVEVLPERRGVKTATQGDEVTFTVSDYGDYTLVFDEKHLNPFTLVVRSYEDLSFLGKEYNGYNVIEYKPGIHYVDNIDIEESNTILYLHSGALLVAKQPDLAGETPTLNPDWAGQVRWKSFLTASYVDNVKIMGHGAIDFTNLNWHARSPVTVTGCKNFEMSGITLINAPEWNVTVQYSSNVNIHDMVIFGYRQNSDGIAICDTTSATVENCFIRSGDDLFEAKSLSKSSETGGKDIVFRNCTAWADKCRGFGIIQETKNDIDGVLYEGCQMLFKMQDWSEELGSLVVVVGDGGTISNVTFRDMEVYYEKGYAINVSLGPTDWSGGEQTGKIKNVTFENIKLRQNKNVRIRAMESLPASDLDGIIFKDVYFGGNKISSLSELNVKYIGNHGNISIS